MRSEITLLDSEGRSVARPFEWLRVHVQGREIKRLLHQQKRLTEPPRRYLWTTAGPSTSRETAAAAVAGDREDATPTRPPLWMEQSWEAAEPFVGRGRSLEAYRRCGVVLDDSGEAFKRECNGGALTRAAASAFGARDTQKRSCLFTRELTTAEGGQVARAYEVPRQTTVELPVAVYSAVDTCHYQSPLYSPSVQTPTAAGRGDEVRASLPPSIELFPPERAFLYPSTADPFRPEATRRTAAAEVYPPLRPVSGLRPVPFARPPQQSPLYPASSSATPYKLVGGGQAEYLPMEGGGVFICPPSRRSYLP